MFRIESVERIPDKGKLEIMLKIFWINISESNHIIGRSVLRKESIFSIKTKAYIPVKLFP